MDYLFLIYADENAVDSLSDAERREIVAGHMAVYGELAASGRLRYASPLADSPGTRTLGPDGVLTDGPYAETKEQIGSIYVVDCPSPAEAEALARRFPAAPGHHIEIREAPEV
jgi:hypothetical protein